MELRMLLYGYNKHQFRFLINETESAVVRGIFDEYISGGTLQKIADRLTAENTVYYKDKTVWNKHMVRRILENPHYTGDDEYPAIVDKAVFERANEIRLKKCGTREIDSEREKYFKYHTVCGQCGGRFTRRRNWSSTREKWFCTCGCKSDTYIDDTVFYGQIRSVLSRVIENPDVLIVPSKAENTYAPSLEVLRAEKETSNGKTQWSKENIRRMLTNEKYVGDVIYQKTFRTDCISKHTKVNRGERTKYLISNNHPAIVDRDLFNSVQAEIARRSSKRRTSDKTLTPLGKYSGKYALSELLICAECGSHYKRKTWTNGNEKRIYWRCLNRIEHGAKYCPHSKGFEEKRLHSAICRALKKAVNDNAESLLLIKANLAYAVTGDETNLDLGAIEKRIKEATKEMEEYMVSYRNTGGDKNRYLECIQSAADEIKALRVQLETAKSKLEKCDEANAEIKRLCDWLDCHDTSFADYDDIVIRRVVECIKVHKDGTITVITKFGTEATETI